MCTGGVSKSHVHQKHADDPEDVAEVDVDVVAIVFDAYAWW